MTDIFAQIVPMFIVTFGVFLLFFLFMGVGYLVRKNP